MRYFGRAKKDKTNMKMRSFVNVMLALFVAFFAVLVYLFVQAVKMPYDEQVRIHCSTALNPEACVRMLTEQ